MAGVELVVVNLGAAVVKSASKIWLGDKSIAADTTASAVDMLSQRAGDLIQRRRVTRMFDQMADVIAEKLQPFIEVEFKNLPANEKVAAIEAVKDTFEKAALTDEELFAQDLNARYVAAYLRRTVPDMPRKALLSESSSALYEILLRECAEYLVQVTRTLPEYQSGALTELLRRDTEIITTLKEIVRRLPERTDIRSADDFRIDYRRQVANTLDRMELFGASLSEDSRRYPLSIAYINLGMTGEGNFSGQREDSSSREANEQHSINSVEIKIEAALSRTRRIFLRGDAGGGKTTLLRWIAVRSALAEFNEEICDLNESIPFFVPLRRYVDQELPSPGDFLENVGKHISDEMPKGWVQAQLRAGRGVVLIDGVDELPRSQREKARSWLHELVTAFPESRYIITSRPGAASSTWLKSLDFSSFELQPMSISDMKTFVHQWHEAMVSKALDTEEKENLRVYERRLIESLVTQRNLKSIAQAPLMCALLCALHYDRRSQLPKNRMELYAVALEMLLERRDTEREVAAETNISRTHKSLLLQDIAYWLIRNGMSDAPKSEVIARIEMKLPQMPHLGLSADSVYRHLIERTGLIREPISDRVDFVHRTFQEYLAAIDVLAADDIGLLVKNAHFDQWREVVIMAAGHAYTSKREQLLRGLLERAGREYWVRDQLHLLAVACLDTSPEISVALRDEIRRRVEELLPPTNMTTAKSLASAGDFVIELLAATKPESAKKTAATIRAAAEIGSDASLRIVARYRDDERSTVQKELLRAWSRFDPAEYAREVLKYSPASTKSIEIQRSEFLQGVPYLESMERLVIHVYGLEELPSLHRLQKLSDLLISTSGLNEISSLGNLPALKRLRIFRSNVVDLSPLQGSPELHLLSISSRVLKDIGPLRQLKNLQMLGLSNCTELSDISALAELEKIKFLTLGRTSVVNLSSLRSLVDLSELSLTRCKASDYSPLEMLSRLENLDLSFSKFSDFSTLLAMEKLKDLDISGSMVDDISGIHEMTSLIALNMQESQVSDASHLGGLENLQILSMGGAIEKLPSLEKFSNLRTLSIALPAGQGLDGTDGLNSLRSIYLTNCSTNVLNSLGDMPNLHRMFLHSEAELDLAALQKFESLREVIVQGPGVRDTAPLESLPRLTRLALGPTILRDVSLSPRLLNVTSLYDSRGSHLLPVRIGLEGRIRSGRLIR